MNEQPAVQRYKNVVAELAVAADELRERDRALARELKLRLVDLDADMGRAEVASALALFAAEMAWEQALDALWQEQWMTLRPRPSPADGTDPDLLDALVEEVEAASTALQEAVHRRFWKF